MKIQESNSVGGELQTSGPANRDVKKQTTLQLFLLTQVGLTYQTVASHPCI